MLAAVGAALLVPILLRSRARGRALIPVGILYVAGLGRLLTVAANLDHFHDASTAPLDTGISRLTTGSLAVLAILGAVGRFPAKRWLAALVVYSGVAVPASAAIYGGLDVRLFLLPALAVAVASCWNTPVDTVTRHVCRIVDVIVVSSLALYWLNPAHSTVVGGRRIVGNHQLAGLTAHPNELGFVAAVAVIVHLYHRNRLRPVWIAVSVVALLLTQSRSSWLAALVGVFIWSSGRLGKWKSRALFAVTGWAAWSAYGQTVNASGLTGRDRVWSVAWGLFIHNPILGAGPNGLPKAVAGTALEFGGQAHNQLFDTLAKAGFIGGLFLVAFFVTGFIAARKSAAAGSSIALALFGALAARAVFESPVGVSLPFLAVLAVLAARPVVEADRPVAGFRRSGQRMRLRI